MHSKHYHNKIVILYYMQGMDSCSLPGSLEVNAHYVAQQFLQVSGLERETESFFYNLVFTVVDGYTFLFAGNREEEIFQVYWLKFIYI